MKDKYAGDVNDFAKYGLLRWLASGPERLRLGVIWYLTPEAPGGDGGRVQYLSTAEPNRFSSADRELFQKLGAIVADQQRSTAEIARRDILPADTVYYAEPIVSRRRAEWFLAGSEALSGCDLVFLDPDNGLAPPQRAKAAAMHATLDEVQALRSQGHSVVVIQFLNRRAAHVMQLRTWLSQVSLHSHDLLPAPWAFHWRTGSSLGFMIIPSTRHAATLVKRLQSLAHSPWAGLFDVYVNEPAPDA